MLFDLNENYNHRSNETYPHPKMFARKLINMLNDDVGVFMCACLNKKCSGRFGGVEAFSRLYFAAFRCVFSHIFLVFAQRWTQKRNSESSFFLLLMSFSLLTFCVPLPPIISMSMKTTYIYIYLYTYMSKVFIGVDAPECVIGSLEKWVVIYTQTRA